MLESIQCYLRRRRGNCLFEAILEKDTCIKDKKRQLQVIEKKCREMENRLDEILSSPDSWQNILYEDGFEEKILCRYRKADLMPKNLQVKQCPYKDYDCQDVLALKKRVLVDYTNRCLEQVTRYNQLVSLWQAICCYKVAQKIELLYHFRKDDDGIYAICLNRSRESLVYFFTKPNQMLVEQVTLTVTTIKQEEVLRGTVLDGQVGKESWMLKIEGAECLEMKQLRQMAEGLKMLLQHQKKHKAGQGTLSGCYMDLSKVPFHIRRSWAHLLQPLGYQLVGQINEFGIFKQAQQLVYRIS